MSKINLFVYISFCFTLAFCASKRNCDALTNIRATVYTGGNDPQEIVVKKTEDLKNAYKIKIFDQIIPNLCKGTFSNLVRLNTLEINSCKITDVEAGAFENLPSLRSLVITGNNFPEIPKNLFGDLLVRKLNLSDNGLEKIQADAFENMINLEVLDLSSNKLTNFEGNWFKNTPNLYRLEAQRNQISKIPKAAFADLIRHKFKKHDLELWFMHNKIQTIDKKAFEGVEKIESLWLNDNEINDIDVEVFANVQDIRTMYLDNNKLDCLNDQVLENLHVQELDVDGNPFSCECLKRVKRWSRDNNVHLQSLRLGLKCLMVSFERLMQKNVKE